MGPLKIILPKPIKRAGKPDLTEIEFREPTSDDIFDLGIPYELTITRNIGETGAISSRSFKCLMLPPIFKSWCLRLSGLGAEELQLPPLKVMDVFNWLTDYLRPEGTSDEEDEKKTS